jgi:hypothetical protein
MDNKIIDELLKHAYNVARSSVLPDKEKHYLVDRTLRSASDLYSCEMDTLTHSSSNVRRYCKYWSTDALFQYQLFRDQGMTHRQACNGKVDGKSAYINEHEIPLQIIKIWVIDIGCDFDEFREFFYNYGKTTVLTKKQDTRLLQKTSSLAEAKERYSNANIRVVEVNWAEFEKSQVSAAVSLMKANEKNATDNINSTTADSYEVRKDFTNDANSGII